MKKFVISFLVLLILSSSSTLPLSVSADTTPTPAQSWYNQSYSQFVTKVTTPPQNEIFGERYTVAQINWIVNGLAFLMTQSVTSADFGAQLQKIIDNAPKGAAIPSSSLYSMGLPGVLTASIIDTYTNPPASGVQYIASGLEKLELAPPAFAQGYGYKALSGLQKLWEVSRNLSMAILALLLVASGFMIMFRIKINPQTVISIQTLIPKLALTLILIFFSYPIAGLVIDLTYAAVGLVLGLLTTTGAITSPLPLGLTGLTGWFTQSNYFAIVFYFTIPMVIVLLLLMTVSATSGGIGFLTVPIPLLSLFASLISGLGILGIILVVVLLLWVCWLLFQIWWTMVKSYISLMAYIVLGPWYIMLGIVPGQKGFSDWLRSIVAEASVFFTIPLMFALNMIIWPLPQEIYKHIPTNLGLFSFLTILSPIDSSGLGLGGNLPNLPLFAANGFLLQLVLGYVILALMPKAALMIKDALNVKPFKYESAFGEAISGGVGMYQGSVKRLQEADERRYKLRQMKALDVNPSWGSGGISGIAKDAFDNATKQPAPPNPQAQPMRGRTQ